MGKQPFDGIGEIPRLHDAASRTDDLRSDNAVMLPASALIGALVLIWTDLAARLIMAPEDLPIGVVTGLVGGLAFIWLMRRG